MTVSYCIPLYNKERYVAAVIEAAVAERALTGGEILVYDDASTDSSRAIAAGFAARCPVRLIEGVENRGVFAATALLVEQAAEDFLRIIDADDLIVTGSTRHLLGLLQRHDAVLAHGAMGQQKAAASPDFAAAVASIDPAPIRPLLRNIDFNLSASLMPRAAALDILPLPPGLRVSQDLCVTLRLAKRGHLVGSNAIVALQPDETDNRLSRRVAAMYRDICLIIAEEVSAEIGRGDAAFAVRRQAGRCHHYFRREAPGRLHPGDRLFLARCRLAHALEPLGLQARRLRRIADFFERDAGRVLN